MATEQKRRLCRRKKLLKDVEALCSRNVCEKEDEERCREEIGSEKFFKWACEKCEKRKSAEIHPWTNHILFLRRLGKAGFPFGKDDLSMNEWLDLGLANEVIESKMRVL